MKLREASGVMILGAALVTGLFVTLGAQQATVTVPVLHYNTSQWGAAALPAATILNDANPNQVSPIIGSSGLVYDGTAWARWKGTALLNVSPAITLTARNSVGAALVDKPSRWSVVHNPGAGTQASASIAAEALVRHVVDCISFSAGSTTAPALTALTVAVRDGATGAGTIIWTHQLVISAATGQNVAPSSNCGLALAGTTNTAMTMEFSASLANLIESVSITGYNVQ